MDTLAHKVPRLSPLPHGVVEWVLTPTRLYGMDQVGQLYIFTAPPPVAARPSLFRRVKNARHRR